MVSAPPATVVIAKPNPRATFTATTTGRLTGHSRTSAGTPSSARPAASDSRYPARDTTRGVASSPATPAASSAAVASPAPAPEPDDDFTYSGTTDSGRKKLISAPMTDTNRTSSGRVISGGNAAAAGRPAAGLACSS